VVLQWIGYEELVNDFADWLQGSSYEGPVWAFDSFERQTSKLTAPRPDNYPAPEPSSRLRVTRGFENIPEPTSLIVVGPDTPDDVANRTIENAPEGCFLIGELNNFKLARECIPLLHCGNQVAVSLQ
jgi:hypothetical protein